MREFPSAEGLGVGAAFDRALKAIEPYGTGNLSPRFWGWVMGSGTVAGILGDWLAASMNANPFAGVQGPVELELAVLGWLRDWFEFPKDSSGILLDGASAANRDALAIARHWKTEGRVKRDGSKEPLRLYASSAVHNSVVKAAELLGLGSSAVRTIPGQTLDLAALTAAVDEDIQNGAVPFCVVASAGTVGLGAIDAFAEIHAFCKERKLWLHVDGAVGALGYLSPKLRPLFAGMPHADSLALDFHKWGQAPYDAGCLLVRDAALHKATFAVDAAYLSGVPGHAFHHHTTGLSRRDRALKLWMTFQAYGMKRVVSVFEDTVAHAKYLATQVKANPRFELLAEPTLNIVCFRYANADDATHASALQQLQSSGTAVLSPHRHDGRACFRVALSNHRTTRADLDTLLAYLTQLP